MNYEDFILRIFLAIILGFLIGLERQITGHMSAGIRINVLICMGVTFFTTFPMFYGSEQVFRIGASIITGVGFLCSGVIFKDNGSVSGINTAATLWCTAAIGLLISTNYILAIIATIMLIVSNLILRPLARHIKPIGQAEDVDKKYRICITCDESAENEIRQLIISGNNRKTLFLNNLKSGEVIGDKIEVIADFYSVGRPKIHEMEELVYRALENDHVVGAGWEMV